MNATLKQKWAWWRAALKDPTRIGKDLPIHENEPQIGFYRVTRGKGQKGWLPVTIFEDPNGALSAVKGPWDPDRTVPATDVWTWCARNPISHEIWVSVAQNGEKFPDSIDALIKDVPGAKSTEPASIGDNSGSEPKDILAELSEGLEELAGRALAEAEKLGKPSAATWNDDWQLKADRITNFVNAIDGKESVGGLIEQTFRAEKDPHVAAGKAVDNRWRAIRERRDDIIARLKRANEPLLKAKRDYETEKRRKAIEAARVTQPTFDTTPPVVDPVKVKSGTEGRSMALVTKKFAQIDDPVAFASFLLKGKDGPHPDVMEVLRKLAQRLVVSGSVEMGIIPGVSVRIEEVAR